MTTTTQHLALQALRDFAEAAAGYTDIALRAERLLLTGGDPLGLLSSPRARAAAAAGRKAAGRALAREIGDLGRREQIAAVLDIAVSASDLRRAGLLPDRPDQRALGYGYECDGRLYECKQDRPATLPEVFAEVRGLRGATIVAPTGRTVLEQAGSMSRRAELVRRR